MKAIVNVKVRGGASLIDLIIVILIIAILLTLTLPAIQNAREASRQQSCASNLRQLAIACLSFESVHKRLPPGTNGCPEVVYWREFRLNPSSEFYFKRYSHASFSAIVLPHFEGDSIYNKVSPIFYDLNHRFPIGTSTWFAEIQGFRDAAKEVVPLLLCPSDDAVASKNYRFTGGSQPVLYPHRGDDAMSFIEYMGDYFSGELQPTNYVASAGPYSGGIHPDPDRTRFRGPMSSGSKVTLADVQDGTSMTIMLSETLGYFGNGVRTVMQPWIIGGLAVSKGTIPWNTPPRPQESLMGDRYNSAVFGFGSSHPTVNVSNVDASIQRLSRDIDWKVLYGRSGMADGVIPGS